MNHIPQERHNYWMTWTLLILIFLVMTANMATSWWLATRIDACSRPVSMLPYAVLHSQLNTQHPARAVQAPRPPIVSRPGAVNASNLDDRQMARRSSLNSTPPGEVRAEAGK